MKEAGKEKERKGNGRKDNEWRPTEWERKWM